MDNSVTSAFKVVAEITSTQLGTLGVIADHRDRHAALASGPAHPATITSDDLHRHD